MYEKFGEFDSCEEINRSAAAQLAEGDIEAIFALAQENGLDKEDAQDYIDGYIPELTTPAMAAMGKLDTESADLKIEGVLADWVAELKLLCMNEEEFAIAVRKKGKYLMEYIALTADLGYKRRAVVDKRIVDKTKEVKKIIGSHEFAIGIPNAAERKELARRYYMGEKK